MLKTKEFVNKVKGKYSKEVEEIISSIETVYESERTKTLSCLAIENILQKDYLRIQAIIILAAKKVKQSK